MAPTAPARCPWAEGDALLGAYHDTEWGVPVHDDRHHFELLSLEGAQAGLSWRTVLAKRDGYRSAFADFAPEIVARYTDVDLEAIRQDPGVIRHAGKLASVVGNAAAFLGVARDHGTFDAFIWRYVGGTPIVHAFAHQSEVPASSELAATLSADLRALGFAFVGPTICYSYLQAAGLVCDHLTTCPRWPGPG